MLYITISESSKKKHGVLFKLTHKFNKMFCDVL